MSLPVDTLVCDTARIAAWQQDSAFDYNRELIEPEQSILQWLFEVIIGFLTRIIDGRAMSRGYSSPLPVWC